MSEHVDEVLRQACLEIEKRWEMRFLEIGLDRDHVHFLIQTVPSYSPSRMVQIVKSVVAREVFVQAPEVKQKLWGGAFWGEGNFVNTVGQHGSEKVISSSRNIATVAQSTSSSNGLANAFVAPHSSAICT